MCGTENKHTIIASAVCATVGSGTRTHVAPEAQRKGIQLSLGDWEGTDQGSPPGGGGRENASRKRSRY